MSATRISSPARPELPAEAFAKHDPSPDPHFYREPRFVTHIDEPAIAAVTRLYAERLPSDGIILDMMSSWVSHLPPEKAFAAVNLALADPDSPPNEGRSYNEGSITLALGRDVSNAGQAALIAARDSDSDYNFKVTLNDQPATGANPKPTPYLFKAKVMSFTTNIGGHRPVRRPAPAHRRERPARLHRTAVAA